MVHGNTGRPPANKGRRTSTNAAYLRRVERDGGHPFGGTREYNRKRAAVFARDGGCVWCGATADLRLDHIVERRERPDHSLENLQALCHPCHVAKTKAYTDALMRLRAAHPEEFDALLSACYDEARQADHLEVPAVPPQTQRGLW